MVEDFGAQFDLIQLYTVANYRIACVHKRETRVRSENIIVLAITTFYIAISMRARRAILRHLQCLRCILFCSYLQKVVLSLRSRFIVYHHRAVTRRYTSSRVPLLHARSLNRALRHDFDISRVTSRRVYLSAKGNAFYRVMQE